MLTAAELIASARKRVGITQAELASRVGTTQSAIARVESGRTEPSLARVDQLVRACGARLAVALDGAARAVPAGRATSEEEQARYQRRWEDMVRMANFVLEGRRAVAHASSASKPPSGTEPAPRRPVPKGSA